MATFKGSGFVRGRRPIPQDGGRVRGPRRAAYKAQAPLLGRRAYLFQALAIHSVEARHAAWIRRLAGIVPAADAFDEPRSKRSTLAIVDATHSR
jgi:hypothetical protein